MTLRRPALALVLGASFLAAGGCAANLKSGSSVPTVPTAAPSATASTAACTQTASANVQIVAISPLVTPTTDPTYGVIAGYGLVASGNSNNVAAPVLVTTTQSIQFFNNDESGSQLRYSAVGIPAVTSFPAPTYTFPPSTIVPLGTQINRTTAWSTGLLGGQCYSQAFTIAAPGVYYFGDYNYYGLANLRDVIVASTPTP